MGMCDARRPHNQLQYFHVWFNFGQLIFVIHKWKKPTSAAGTDLAHVLQISDKWNNLETRPSRDDIVERKKTLQWFENQEFELSPRRKFYTDLRR